MRREHMTNAVVLATDRCTDIIEEVVRADEKHSRAERIDCLRNARAAARDILDSIDRAIQAETLPFSLAPRQPEAAPPTPRVVTIHEGQKR